MGPKYFFTSEGTDHVTNNFVFLKWQTNFQHCSKKKVNHQKHMQVLFEFE